MADTKISALTSLTGANVDAAADVLAIVDTSVTTTKKILVSELFTLTNASPQITLGLLNTTSGGIKFFGSTSGNVTLAPNVAAGASVTVTLPAVTDTLAVLGANTFTGIQTFGAALVGAATQSAFNTVTTRLDIGGGATTGVFLGNASGTNTFLGATTFSQAGTFSGRLDVGTTLRVSGSSAPASGAGVEIIYTASLGQIYSYDRSGAAAKNLELALGVLLLNPNTNTATLGGTIPARVAGDVYLIVDASGNIHKSAVGPAS